MTTTIDTARHGRTSQDEGDEAIKQSWQQAAELNATYEGTPGEFVPKDAIFVDDSINPREGANVDMAIAREYGAILLSLPPIKVQKDTFRLIDGKHRITAAYLPEYGYDCIRIEEVDVPDEELIHAAFKANAAHGRPLLASDRILYIKRLIEQHGKSISITKYQEMTGLSRPTVIKYRDQNGLDEEQIQEQATEKKERKQREKAVKVVPAADAPPFTPPAPVEPPPFVAPEEETAGSEAEGEQFIRDAVLPIGSEDLLTEDDAPQTAQEPADAGELTDVPDDLSDTLSGIKSPQERAWWAIQVLGREDSPLRCTPEGLSRVLPKHLHNTATLFSRQAFRWLTEFDAELNFNS